jgi:hypothetical protein
MEFFHRKNQTPVRFRQRETAIYIYMYIKVIQKRKISRNPRKIRRAETKSMFVTVDVAISLDSDHKAFNFLIHPSLSSLSSSYPPTKKKKGIKKPKKKKNKKKIT